MLDSNDGTWDDNPGSSLGRGQGSRCRDPFSYSLPESGPKRGAANTSYWAVKALTGR